MNIHCSLMKGKRCNTIYRHVFHCSTAHQCSLVQSGYGMATIYTQASVSDNRLWDNSCHAYIQRALSYIGSNYHKGSGLCIIAKGHPHQLHRVLNFNKLPYIYIYIYIYGSLLVIYFNYEFMRVCIKLNLRKHF